MENKNSSQVVNLSSEILTPIQVKILTYGLNFCPTPLSENGGELKTDLNKFHRRLRLAAKFEDEEDPTQTSGDLLDPNLHSSDPFKHRKFKPISSYNPVGPPNLEAMINTNELDFNKRPELGKYNQNISQLERRAIVDLKNNHNIIIKPADKGSAVVIQNRSDYLNEGFKQLSDDKFYKKTDLDLTKRHNDEIKKFVSKIYREDEIDTSVYLYLTEFECRTSRLYLLPKIHKKTFPPPGRPIVSANGSPTERISQLVDHFLNPPTQLYIKSYVQDTTDFIKKIMGTDILPQDCLLVTLDVTSLYTNIPNNLGIEAAAELLLKHRPQPYVKPSNANLIHLLKLVLTKNNFQFNGENYLQVGGTAMGTKVAPSFANTFMGKFETKFVYPYKLQPLLFLRYLDDIFMIWQHGLTELRKFHTYLNSCLPTIKFTLEFSDQQITFLDTLVRLRQNRLETDLYCKPTDSHNYLLYKSAHPQKCKDSIPYSQFLRIRRICSNVEDFDKHVLEFTSHFIRRGYPIPLLTDAALAARRSDRLTLLTKTTKPKHNSVILVTRYHPVRDILREIILENWDFLGKSPTTETLFHKKLRVAYKRPKNLRDMIVRADCRIPRENKPRDVPSKNTDQSTSDIHSSKSLTNQPTSMVRRLNHSASQTLLTTPIMRVNKCIAKKQCRYCPQLNMSGNITCTVTGRSIPCKTNISCMSSNLVYCITCDTCKKQYVGQTKRKIKDRFQGHFYSVTKTKKSTKNPSKNERQRFDPIGNHFKKAGHNGMRDLRISVLAFITLPPRSKAALDMRLAVELKWIHEMRCPAPSGLNVFS